MTVAVYAVASSSSADQSFAWVLSFGQVADACGRLTTVANLKGRSASQGEGGQAALGEPRVRAAIDQVLAGDDLWVSPGQPVAFLSAFSGG